MKAFICGVCGYVSLTGAAPERCPVCGVPKEKFTETEDAVKIAKDSKNLTELEKKHIPVLNVIKKCGLIPEDKCTDITIRIGQILHPMLPEHSIMRIDFYLDNQFIGNIKFTPEKLNPAAVLHFKQVSGKFAAVEHCNLHGNWIAEINL